LYPKQLPATYEFRRPQLLKLGSAFNAETAKGAEMPMRYGHGKLVLYNFSDREVSGSLVMPKCVTVISGFPNGAELGPRPTLTLAPGERREMEVSIKVTADGFKRVDALVEFVPNDSAVPPAKFLTCFMPDIAGMKSTLGADLLRASEDRGQKTEDGGRMPGGNRAFIETRKRAAEEAPMHLAIDDPKLVAFAQEGASVEATADGFSVTVSSRPPGKPQRVEVEIPWPDGLNFSPDEFLSVEYRLRP
jgi:hypothetical protein